MSDQEFTRAGADAPGDERALEGAGGSARPPSDDPACRRAHAPAGGALRELRTAFLRAVAVSWVDPSKLDFLKSDPRRFLSVLCGYDLPRNITLIVGEARESREAERRPAGWDVLQERWDWPAAEIVLDLPPPPALDEQAVALAEIGHDSRRSGVICC